MNQENNLERQQIEEKIASLRGRSMSESMSSAAVESFFERQVEADRLQTILVLSDKTDLPTSEISRRSQVEHNVMATLILQGDIEGAKKVISDIKQAREENPEVFEKAEKFVASQNGLPGSRKTS